MKIYFLKFSFVFTLCLAFHSPARSIDSLEYKISLIFSKDLSDTYDGGNLFSSDLCLVKSWYGLQVSFGLFQSHSQFKYTVLIEELNKTITIPFDEIAIMKSGSVSLVMGPIKNKIITTDIMLGLAIGKAESSQFHDVQYSYSIIDNKFNYLYKNYELIEKYHFGYQVGFNISFYPLKKMGFQVNARIQDLSNGGTFFFVGGGLCFKL